MKSIKRLHDQAEREVACIEAKLCDEIRDRLVVPYCKRRGLTFIAGMGSWRFWKGDEQIDDDKLPREIRDALNRPCLSNSNVQDIGSLVPDYGGEA